MDQKQKILAVHFAQKIRMRSLDLIAGPGVYICDECIDSCYNLIQEQTIKDKKDQHQGLELHTKGN